MEKELWQIDQQRGSTKRSQFASLSRRGGRTGPEERRRQPRVAGANCAKRTQFGPTTETAGVPNGENVQNKPNWGPLGEIWRAKTRETNPIRPRRASVGGKCAKRTQFPSPTVRVDVPMPNPRSGRGQALRRDRLWRRYECVGGPGASVRNKANSPERGLLRGCSCAPSWLVRRQTPAAGLPDWHFDRPRARS